MLCANGAPADIADYVCIYAGPTHSLSCLSLHPIKPLMCCMQVGKSVFEQLWGYVYPCPLEEQAGINGQFVLGSSEVSGYPGDLLPALRPTSKGVAIDGAIHWVKLHRALNDVQFSIRQLHMLDIFHNGDGEGVTLGGEVT